MATALFKDASSYPLIASVMVIDDQLTSRIILESILKTIGNNITVRSFDNALSALDVAEQDPPDLIIADYKMPELDGVEFTRRLRGLPGCEDIPVVIVTIVDEKAVLYQALEAGATDFLAKPIDHYECKVRCRNLLTMRRQQLIIRNRASSVETQINEAIQQARQHEKNTLALLATIGSHRDKADNLTHCIGRFAAIIAESLNMDEKFCECIEVAAPLYDIGKVTIPDEILLKPWPLDQAERTLMQAHTTQGYDLLKGTDSPYLQMAATMALYHHEMYNGEGYPHGLKGEDIPLSARIAALADVFFALINKRPYKTAWSIDETLKEIHNQRGTHFDPECVDALFSQLDKILACMRDPDGGQVNNF